MHAGDIETGGPSASQVRVFGLLMAAFGAVMALIVLWRPHGLFAAAAFCAVATLATLLIQRRAENLLGFLIPGILLLLAIPPRLGVNPRAVAIAALGVGIILGVAILVSPSTGRAIYNFWMRAAEPIGYSVTMFVLVLAFYLVFTPVALLLRLVGRDPLSRAFDRAAPTYWVEHNPADCDSARYFKQF